MKNIFSGLIGAAALTACWGAPPNEMILKQSCTDLFDGDAEITQSLVGEGAGTVEAYCTCYAALTVKDTAATTLHKDVLGAINVTRSETGLGVEDAVKQVEATMTNDGAYDTFTTEQLDGVGDYFQNIAQQMGEAGQCPAQSG